MESLYFIEILYVVGEGGVKNKQPTDTSLWNVFAQCLLLLKMVFYDQNLIQHPCVVIGDDSLQIGQETQRNQVTVRGSRGSWSSTDFGCCHYSFFTDRKEKYVLTTQQSVLVFCHDARCQSKESSQIWLYTSHTSSGTNPVCQLPLLTNLYWKFIEYSQGLSHLTPLPVACAGAGCGAERNIQSPAVAEMPSDRVELDHISRRQAALKRTRRRETGR